jgi:transposase InsO family protein
VVVDRAIAIKHDYYGRGALSVKIDLEDEFGHQHLIPSRSSLSRLFKGRAEVQRYEPNRPLPQTNQSKGSAVHELWQIDDMGAEQYAGVGYAGMLNVKDVFSRVQSGTYLILYQHCRQHPSTKDYVHLLRRAFTDYGMPKNIQADHGSLFHENNSKSPFPTRLHLWLVGIGIHFQHSRTYKPTDQAVIERTHQTMHKQLVRKTPYQSLEALQQTADERRNKLNTRIPCSGLDNKTPMDSNPQAIHSGKFYQLDKESQLFNPERVNTFLEKLEWFRIVSKDNTFSLGKQVYYDNKLTPKTQIRIIFDASTQRLNCYNINELVATVPIKGISYNELTAYF